MSTIVEDLRADIERRNILRRDASLPLLSVDDELARLEMVTKQCEFERWLREHWSLRQELMGDLRGLSHWGRMARESRVRVVMKSMWESEDRSASR